MSLRRRTALRKTKTNYLNYAGDTCWEIVFHDCLFVVIAVYYKQRRSKELFLCCVYNKLLYLSQRGFCFVVFCFGGFFFAILCTSNSKEERGKT